MKRIETGSAVRDARRPVIVALIVVALLACVAVVAQQRQLVRLRETRAQFLDQAGGSSSEPIVEPENEFVSAKKKTDTTDPEVLALRGEISRLLRRKQELQRVQTENGQLRSQLDTRTNAVSQAGFVAGYVRKAAAQNLGFSRPEDTLQTFLWAVAHRDVTNVVLAFTPEFGAKIMPGMSAPSATDALLGMGVASRTNLPDGRVVLQVQIVPGMPFPKIGFRQINGEWKIDEFD